jgi:hypothetical protein
MKVETNEALRNLVARQHNAIAAMCKNIAEVHEQLAVLHVFSDMEFLRFLGKQYLSVMDTIGDIANNMDIVQESDAWIDDVFVDSRDTFSDGTQANQEP